ncbi:MAG: hypothetical protein QNJ46_33945 [Leptolyngbyaceae cyanobacterium MO_188.B28]|nr:hypothetical protein [Leptolyngbyaceae cyanobacterium MO_188.B28]
MKRIIALMASIVLISSIAAPAVLAQESTPQPAGMGQSSGSRRFEQYDPANLETISGEVLRVIKTSSRRGQGYGIHLLVQTDEETVEVHLGPEWYLTDQNFNVEPEDAIEVEGARVAYEGAPAIIATEVTKGEEVLTLRDDNGFPAWRGTGMGRQR